MKPNKDANTIPRAAANHVTYLRTPPISAARIDEQLGGGYDREGVALRFTIALRTQAPGARQSRVRGDVMRLRGIVFRTVCLGLLLAFVVAAAASADTTLGLTTQASGATAGTCASAPAPTLVQSTQDSTTPYFAPTDGVITQWRTNTTGDTPGATITFAVVRAVMAGGYTVVGADTETIPNPLPVSGVATFTLTTPITVHSGDTLALYSSSAGVNCYSYGGSTPAGDNVVAVQDAVPPPAAGQALTTSAPCTSCTLDVAASFSPTEDAGVTTSVGPSNAMAGSQALLSSTVSNLAGDPGPIRFTDTLPAGLTINAVAAGQGTCATSGQIVTCTITDLAPGQGVPVDVVVDANRRGHLRE